MCPVEHVTAGQLSDPQDTEQGGQLEARGDNRVAPTMTPQMKLMACELPKNSDISELERRHCMNGCSSTGCEKRSKNTSAARRSDLGPPDDMSVGVAAILQKMWHRAIAGSLDLLVSTPHRTQKVKKKKHHASDEHLQAVVLPCWPGASRLQLAPTLWPDLAL